MTVNNEMDFEFMLKQSFDEEQPELPESLKKENVIMMLENEKSKPIKKKKHLFPKILTAAAALVIVVACAVVVPVIVPDKPLVDATTTTQELKLETDNTTTEAVKKQEVKDNGLEATRLKQAQSNEELQKHFLKLYRENKIDDALDVFFGATDDALEFITDEFYNTGVDMYAAPESAVQNAAPAVTSQAAATTVASAQNSSDKSGSTDGDRVVNYGQTNTQVENVDEADIIKNDGKYLYILSGGVYNNGKRVVTIVDVANMAVASKIEINDEAYRSIIQEMYVNGDRLVLVAQEYEKIEDENTESSGFRYYNGKTVSFVYNISDRKKPVLVRKVSQNGSDYISSRMIDGVLYTLSSYYVRGNSEDEVKQNAVPSVNGEFIACDSIYIYDYDSESYTVLTAYDVKLDNGQVSSLSVLGGGDQVYCSGDALYVARHNYDGNDGDFTEIYSFGLNGTEIAYRASGAVKGYFLNQFSFDEYEGNLRVATTCYSYKHDVDVSSIYVLNKNLELIGALEDIAYDEQVKSVRFMGDTGFIVTFRNTDPLFTLDFSDPTAPRVVGEVKLPGFSSYLHPVGDGLVVGLGYDGNEENADFNTLKVSLFDVSDMKNPKEVDTFVLKSVYSQALSNHKAFIYYPEENLIGFPVEHYAQRTVLSYKLLKIENRVIESHLGYTHKTERMTGDVFRGTYIGNKLYTIDNYNVCEFDIETAVLLRECEILDVEKDVPDDKLYGEATTHAVVWGGAAEATTATDVSSDTASFDSATSSAMTTSPTTEVTTQPAEYSFEALVIKVLDNSVLVEVSSQGSSSLAVGTQAYLSSDGDGCEAGDTVKVIFDGVVQETYPVQIPNVLGIGVAKR